MHASPSRSQPRDVPNWESGASVAPAQIHKGHAAEATMHVGSRGVCRAVPCCGVMRRTLVRLAAARPLPGRCRRPWRWAGAAFCRVRAVLHQHLGRSLHTSTRGNTGARFTKQQHMQHMHVAWRRWFRRRAGVVAHEGSGRGAAVSREADSIHQ